MSATAGQLIGIQSRWVTNPKHLPIARVTDTNLSVKSTLAIAASSNNAAFYTAMALQGAAGAITVADTFINLVNVTGGGGFLFHVVAPTHSANFTPTIEITVDGGTPYTIAPTAVFAAQSRLVLGAGTAGVVTSNAGTYNEAQIVQVSGYNDIGFQARIGGINNRATANFTLPDEQMMLSYSMPCLRFESSLLVRVKASLLSAVADDKRCAAAYRLDQ